MSEFKDELKKACEGNLREITDGKIPRIIHRIWVGGKIEPETFNNLILFQDRLNAIQDGRAEKYRNILWTTKSTKENIEDVEQMKLLTLEGMEVKNMDDITDETNIGIGVKKEVERLMQEGNYKFVSDLWRMYILYVMGGIYMDADISIGQETFEEELYHRYRFQSDKSSYMPLLGSASPFKDISSDENIQRYLEQEKELYRKGYPWNYFYATKAVNNVILRALLNLLYEEQDAQTVADYIVQLFYQDIKGNDDQLFIHAFAPLHLQYATKASIDKRQ